MNTQKFNKYLKKINTFGDLIDDLGELSMIEKDLLMDYIKKMYESLAEAEVKGEKKEKKHKPAKNKSIKKELIEEEDIQEDEISFEDPSNEIVQDNTAVKNVIIPEVKEKAEIFVPETKFSPELLELFEVNNSNELSHKLSMSPIKNLTKAFSINERIFTVKELFNGEKNTFEKVIADLDELNSLDEAKNYILENVVSEFNWDESMMIKKVRQFIITIKRRYL